SPADHYSPRPSGCGTSADRGLRRGCSPTAASAAPRIRPRLMGEEQRRHDPEIARRMEPLEFEDLPEQALVLLDSAPIIYFLENHPRLGLRFQPLFEAHGIGRLRFAVTTITIAEVLTGPLRAGDEALA